MDYGYSSWILHGLYSCKWGSIVHRFHGWALEYLDGCIVQEVDGCLVGVDDGWGVGYCVIFVLGQGFRKRENEKENVQNSRTLLLTINW